MRKLSTVFVSFIAAGAFASPAQAGAADSGWQSPAPANTGSELAMEGTLDTDDNNGNS